MSVFCRLYVCNTYSTNKHINECYTNKYQFKCYTNKLIKKWMKTVSARWHGAIAYVSKKLTFNFTRKWQSIFKTDLLNRQMGPEGEEKRNQNCQMFLRCLAICLSWGWLRQKNCIEIWRISLHFWKLECLMSHVWILQKNLDFQIQLASQNPDQDLTDCPAKCLAKIIIFVKKIHLKAWF